MELYELSRQARGGINIWVPPPETIGNQLLGALLESSQQVGPPFGKHRTSKWAGKRTNKWVPLL
jgi:hypothetical protein